MRLRSTDKTDAERTSNQQTTELFHFRSPRRFACGRYPRLTSDGMNQIYRKKRSVAGAICCKLQVP
jgi:hypothetical protein